MASQCRQNYHEECEAAINKQINMELHANYVYMSMAAHFDRDDVALPGFHKYFKQMADGEHEHADILMKYQNQRGGRIILQDIKKPDRDEWGTALDAMQAALTLEKTINQSLLDMYQIASSHSDPQMCDWIDTHFLNCQVEANKDISDRIAELKRCGPGLGEYSYDRLTMQFVQCPPP